MSKQKIVTSRWRTLMIVLCAVFACALFSLGCILFAVPSSAYGANGETPAVESEKAADPLPRREYTKLEVTKSDGLVIYVGKTTAKDLKNNITVKGSYNTGGGTVEVVLDDGEYMISQNDQLIADGSVVYTAKEGDVVPEFFNGEVTCGKISANLSVAYRTEVPTYTKLEVSLPDGVTVDDTFDLNTLKKVLTVTGTVTEVDGETSTERTEVINKELYDLAIASGSIVANGKITVKATLKDDGAMSATSAEISVSRSVATGVVASVRDDVTLIDGIWTKADGYHAFVASENTTAESVLQNLNIFAVYPNTVKPIYQNGVLSGAFNYTCVVTNATFSAGSQNVNIEVRSNTGATAFQTSISLVFESRRLFKIEAEHTKTDATSSSSMQAGDFNVTGTYNDGTSYGTLRTDQYDFSPNTYSPSAENLQNLITQDGKKYYRKKIRITYLNNGVANNDIYCDVTTQLIENVAINTVQYVQVDGRVATQQAGKVVNFDGIYAQVRYQGSNIARRIYLSEYVGKTINGKYYLEYELLKGDAPVLKHTDESQLIPTTDADTLHVKFTFYDTDGTERGWAEEWFETGEILRADVEIPRLNVTPIAYSAGCSKQIGGIDFANVPFDMDLTITSSGSGSLVAKYTVGGTPAVNGNTQTVGASFNALTGAITFLRGDTFTVTIQLKNDDYRWVNTAGNSADLEGDDIVRYTFTINKAELNVQLDSKTIELTYGDLIDLNDNTAFNGWTDKVVYSIMGSANLIDKNDPNRPDFELLYVGFTATDGTYTSLGNTKNLDIAKRGVGSYKVLVRTVVNDAYLSSTTLDGNATTITVKAKPITLNNAIKSETYARTGWDLNHFVNPTTDDLVYGEKFTDASVATITATTNSVALVGGKYYHAGTYGVRFTLVSKNYVWQGETGVNKDATFNINKASFSFSASVANGNYQYKDKTPAPSYSVPSEFYPVVSENYAIYSASQYDVANKKPNSDATNYKSQESSLPVGDYYVHYTTSLGTSGGVADLAGDYDLPTACAAFTVVQKQLDKVTITNPSDVTYNGSGHDFGLSKFDSSIMKIVGVTGTIIGGTTAVTSGITPNEAGKKITVIHAGNYSAEFQLKDKSNYIWKNSGGDTTDDYTLTFQIKQRDIVIKDHTAGKKYTYIYKNATEPHDVPVFVTEEAVALGDGLTIDYVARNSSNQEVSKTDLPLAGVGTYGITLTFTVKSGSFASDYKWSTAIPIPTEFEITAANLTLPVWVAKYQEHKSDVYNGKVFVIKDLFEQSSLNGLTFVIKDKATEQIVELRNAKEYIICITPDANYSWAENQGYGTTLDGRQTVVFNFTVDKADAVFSWSNTSVVYDGTMQVAVAKLNNGLGDDANVAVKVGVKNNITDTTSVDGKTDVGNYVAFAKELSGEGSENYAIQTSAGTYKTSFVINKQLIVLPELSKTATFNENDLTVALDYKNALQDKGWGWLVNSANTYPKVTASISGVSYDGKESVSGGAFNSGVFTYKYAGVYTLTLTIGDFRNYGWQGKDEQSINVVVTVDRQGIKAPSVDIAQTYYYDFNNRIIGFTDNNGKNWGWLANQADAYAKIGVSAAYKNGASLSNAFDLTAGKFTYENAGNYIITFTIGSPLNYFWADGNVSGNSATVEVAVERQRITVPGFYSFYTEFAEDNSSNIPEMTTALPTMQGIRVLYGKVNISRPENSSRPVFESYAGGSDNCTSKDRGEYYIYFGLNNSVAGGNVNNYIFVSPYDSVSVPNYISRIVSITSEGTGIYLHYAITNAMVEVKFENISYTFGQNFFGSSQKTIANQIKVSNGDAARKMLAEEMIKGNVTVTLSFIYRNSISIEGNNEVTYKWTKTRLTSYDINADISTLPWDCGDFELQGTAAFDMANYLPKHADDYILSVNFEYGASSDFQTPSTDVEVTVNKLKVELDWVYADADGRAEDAWDNVYDGKWHAYNPVITNIPSDDSSNSFNLNVKIVKGSDTVTEAKNAGSYVFSLDSISSVPAGMKVKDFTVKNTATKALTINKKAVTVTANDGASHIYGNAFANNGWDDANGFVASEKTLVNIEYFYTDAAGNLVYGTDRNGNSKTDKLVNVGTAYKINAKATGGINLDNYTLSYVSGGYEIEQRPLTVTVKDNVSSVYGEELKTDIYQLSEDVKTTIGDNASLFTLKIYQSEGKSISKYSPVNSYAVTMEDRNGNYNITFVNTNKYTITRATLTVKVDVKLYYGEQFDATFKADNKYLNEKTNGSRNVGIYTVAGFKKDAAFNVDDEDLFYNNNTLPFEGTFTYALSGAEIIFTSANLAWGNYNLTAAETNGALTVEKLPITVTVKNQSVTYFDNANIPALMAQGVGFTVEYPASSYASDGRTNTAIVFESGKNPSDDFGAIFNVTSVAQNKGDKDGAILASGVTNSVGAYPIKVAAVAGNAANYTVIVGGSEVSASVPAVVANAYKIMKAQLTNVATLDDANHDYDEANWTPHETDMPTRFATTSDGTAVSVYFAYSQNGNQPADISGVTMPSFIDAGAYRIYYRIAAENYTDVVKSFVATVNKVNNSFTSPFNYDEKVFNAFADNMAQAWIYGLTAFDNSKIVLPTTQFKRVYGQDGQENGFTVSVYYRKRIADADETPLIANKSIKYGATAAEMAALLDNPNMYNAGYYRIVFTMEGNDNYNTAESVGFFRVGKKELQVTPSESNTVYGKDFAESTVSESYGDFAYGQTSAVLGGMSFSWVAAWASDNARLYAKGDNATNATTQYIIRIDGYDASKIEDETYVYYSLNYDVRFVTSAFTVNKRTVLINISDAENFFNRYTNGGTEDAAELKSTVLSSSPYDYFVRNNVKEQPIELHTNAFDQPVANALTNNAGKYAIYAKFANETFANNYSVKFGGCTWRDALDDAQETFADCVSKGAIQDASATSNAGVFTVKPAVLFVQAVQDGGSYLIYNGNAKVFKPEFFNQDKNSEVQFTVEYYVNNGSSDSDRVLGDKLSGAPKNVGRYIAKLVYSGNDNNYTAYTADTGFTVTPARVNVGWDDRDVNNEYKQWIEYGTNIPNGYAASNRFSGFYITFANGTTSAITGFDADMTALATRQSSWTITAAGYSSAVANATAAGTVITVTVSGISADNYIFNVDARGYMLVKPRNVNVAVKGVKNGNAGARAEYTGTTFANVPVTNGNFNSYFAITSPYGDKWWGDNGSSKNGYELGLTLPLASAQDVGFYDVDLAQISWADRNYAIAFSHNQDQTSQFEIYQKELKVYVTGIDQAVFNQDNNQPLTQNFNVTFGNGIRVNYDMQGFVSTENYGTIQNAHKTTGSLKLTVSNFYVPWQNEVGSYPITYATESDLAFTNYKVTYVEGRFNVTARQVSLRTDSQNFIDSQIYTESLDGNDKPIYNNGVSGARLDARLTFVNQSVGSVNFYDGANDYKLPTLNNGYTLTYSGKSATPNVAGTYNVTVKFTTKNYRFANGSDTLAGNRYLINPKEMPLSWDMANITDFDQKTEAERLRRVGGFIDDIMDVSSFIRSYPGIDQMIDEDVGLLANGATGNGYYKVAGEGIKFTAYATGEYRVTILISAAARNNYVIPNGTNEYTITLLLVVSQDGITFNSVSIGGNGWVYNQYNDLTNAPSAVYDTSNTNGITFMYAKLNNAFDYQFSGSEAKYNSMFLVGDLTGLTHQSGSVLQNGHFSMTMPSTVGLYVVRAYHGATGQSAYATFRISPAQVVLPNFQTGTTYTYNGSLLEVTWEVDASVKQNIIVAEQNDRCYINSVADGLLIREKIALATTYTIQVRLADTENYRLVGNSSFTWTIDKATESITVGDVVRQYSGDNNYQITTETRFGSHVDFNYVEKTAGSDPEKITVWDKTKPPIAVGEYWVKAFTADASNWDGTTVYGSISITKATLTVTPSGTITYGTAFDANGAAYHFDFSGFVGRDIANRPQHSTTGNITYSVAGHTESILPAGSYTLVIDASNIVFANYDVVASNGTLTVNKKSISVSINALSSVYGNTVDLTRATFNVSDGVNASDLGIKLKLVDVYEYANLAAGSYTIVEAGYTNKNYLINFTPGTYTVSRRQITISDINRGGGEVGNVLSPVVNAVTDLQTGAQIPGNSGTFTFEFTYTNQSGVLTGNGGRDKPSAVGTYYLHVAQNNNNYELVGQTAFVFEVARLVIDGSRITVAPVAFNNSDVVPVINYGIYNAEDFNVSYEGDRVNAGSATVVLTIKDTVNRKWLSTDEASYRINFTITQGTNELNSFTVVGWTYGNYDANLHAPKASAKFGSEYIFTYYERDGQTYRALDRRPDEVGTYFVTVTVPQSRNYATFVSDYKQFEIGKATRSVPTLGIITEGEGKNNVYTGSALQALVIGFDSAAMEINYDGISNINGNTLTVFATNAGVYKITLILKDTKNYRWEAGDDSVQLTWTIDRKKIDAPTANTSMFVVNGQTLVYLPNGFDENTMNISGNTSSYGGVFEVTVTLKDLANYEWANGTNGAYVYSWQIVGGETVFTIVACSVGVLAAAAGAVALTQFLLYRKRMAKKANGASAQNDKTDKE